MDVDELKELSAENLCELDYLEGYRCVLPLANIHGTLCCVFKNVYVDDFSVLDLTEPSRMCFTRLQIGKHRVCRML